MNHCETCHWWTEALKHPRKKDFRGCVWLTGTRGSAAEKLRVKPEAVIYTRNDFGCTEWCQKYKVKP